MGVGFFCQSAGLTRYCKRRDKRGGGPTRGGGPDFTICEVGILSNRNWANAWGGSRRVWGVAFRELKQQNVNENMGMSGFWGPGFSQTRSGQKRGGGPTAWGGVPISTFLKTEFSQTKAWAPRLSRLHHGSNSPTPPKYSVTEWQEF